ncbi:MAG TPA: dTMP kinase [Acidiferrobacteraceae bacterium]|nr:dTMP kinase [Acidiferrobacteraceae bacterium]
MSSNQKGLFITLEGGEGAGKSTSLQFMQMYLQDAGCEVIATREPGGTELGEALRELLLHRHDQPTGVDAELLMIFAARAQHLEEVVRPALDAGQWVLCDRFTDATYAYQGGGRGIPTARIAELEQWVQGELRPDLTVLFDLPVLTGMQRVNQRSAPDRFEKEGEVFLEKVRQRYLNIANEQPQRVHVIDASKTPAEVQSQLSTVLDILLT